MATEESVKLVIRASRPNFRNKHDKLAFAVHASFLASGFVLISTGPPAFEENSLSSSSNDEVGIDHWNEVSDKYAFVYRNPKKSNKKVLLKCLVMGDMLMVDALSDGASQPVHLEINVDEYATETASSDYDAQFKNLGKLVSSLEFNFLSKLDRSSLEGVSAGTSRLFIKMDPSNNDNYPNNYPINFGDFSPSLLNNPEFQKFLQRFGETPQQITPLNYSPHFTPTNQIHVPFSQTHEESPYHGSSSHLDECNDKDETIQGNEAPIMSPPLLVNLNQQPPQVVVLGARKWSVREDEALIACYMEHCTDAIITRTGQKAAVLWRKVWESYKMAQASSPHELGVRTLKMLENRWKRMTHEVNLWISCYDEACKIVGTDYNEEDATMIAHRLFRTRSKPAKNFSCQHAWKMFIKYPKWRAKMRWSLSRKERKEVGLDDDEDIEGGASDKRNQGDGDTHTIIGSSNHTKGDQRHPNGDEDVEGGASVKRNQGDGDTHTIVGSSNHTKGDQRRPNGDEDVEGGASDKRTRGDDDTHTIIGNSSHTKGDQRRPNGVKKAKAKQKGKQVFSAKQMVEYTSGEQIVEYTSAFNKSTSLKHERFEFEKQKFHQKQRQLELDEMKAKQELRKANFDMLQVLMAKPSPIPCEVKEIDRLCKELYGDD